MEDAIVILIGLLFGVLSVLVITSPILVARYIRSRRMRDLLDKIQIKYPQVSEYSRVNYASSTQYKKVFKMLVFDGYGYLFTLKDQVMFVGLQKGQEIEFTFTPTQDKIEWVGRSQRNGPSEWFRFVRNTGEEYFFTHDSVYFSKSTDIFDNININLFNKPTHKMENNPSFAPELTSIKKQIAVGDASRWLYTIAGLSAVNTVFFLVNADVQFVIGLGITQVIDSFLYAFGTGGQIIAVILDLVFVGIFALFGYLTSKGHKFATIAGIVLYAFDLIVLLVIGLLLGVLGDLIINIIFHIYAIAKMLHVVWMQRK